MAGKIRLENATGDFSGFESGDVTEDVIWKLPDADGSDGEVLTTDGAKVLSWNPIPDASDTQSGLMNIGAQTFAGAKTFNDDVAIDGRVSIKQAVTSKRGTSTLTQNVSSNVVDMAGLEAGLYAVTLVRGAGGTNYGTHAQYIVGTDGTAAAYVYHTIFSQSVNSPTSVGTIIKVTAVDTTSDFRYTVVPLCVGVE